MSASLRAAAVATFLSAATIAAEQPRAPLSPLPHYESRVEAITIAATVSDSDGRFVSGLHEDDFTVYEDDVRQTIEAFGTERLPVSLGIALDTSGSMAGPKIAEARAALTQFLDRLLDRSDEIFLYRFSDHPVLLEGWTSSRATLMAALEDTKPDGGTAMYDVMAEAVPLAAQGRNRKKAVVLISDGNDTSSNTPRIDVMQLIRETDVLVYAIGIDGNGNTGNGAASPSARPVPPPRGRVPIPVPGLGRPPGFSLQTPAARRAAIDSDRVDAAALRDLTDDSGGRTEIIRDARDLYPATAGIADELSKQYDLSYLSTGKRDGVWHTIRVEVKNPTYRVRARRGYVAN